MPDTDSRSPAAERRISASASRRRSEVAGSGDKGVVVTAVDPDGPAAEHGFQTGDVILDVGGKTVSNVADVRAALNAAKDSGKHDVLMRVKTADATRFVAVPFGKA